MEVTELVVLGFNGVWAVIADAETFEVEAGEGCDTVLWGHGLGFNAPVFLKQARLDVAASNTGVQAWLGASVGYWQRGVEPRGADEMGSFWAYALTHPDTKRFVSGGKVFAGDFNQSEVIANRDGLIMRLSRTFGFVAFRFESCRAHQIFIMFSGPA